MEQKTVRADGFLVTEGGCGVRKELPEEIEQRKSTGEAGA
jgi:hypothetical protein